MNLKKVASGLGRCARSVGWWLLGIWCALAIFYTAPGPSWVGWVLGLAVASIFFTARRRCYEKRWTIAAFVTGSLVAIYYFGFVKPVPPAEWARDHLKMPDITVDGSKVTIKNVRYFTWTGARDAKEAWHERVLDADKLTSMYYIIAPLPFADGVAHVWVSFGFSDGQAISISVEGRRGIDQTYQIIPSMFRQYQLIYTIGEETDVVGLRGSVWKKPVRFYPARISHAHMKAIFLDIMRRAHQLEEKPEFYNLFFNNCLNNITYHIRTLDDHSLPHDLLMLMTGWSDRVMYRLGYIDTDLPFEAAREAFRVDPWMQSTTLDDTFSKRLRETLRRQEAEQRAKLAK